MLETEISGILGSPQMLLLDAERPIEKQLQEISLTDPAEWINNSIQLKGFNLKRPKILKKGKGANPPVSEKVYFLLISFL